MKSGMSSPRMGRAPHAHLLPWVLLSLPAALAAGCGGDDAPGPGGDGTGPVYALHTVVFDPDYNPTSYVKLVESPDIDQVSFDDARELPGYAFVAAFDGKLLVSDGESPVITRYTIDDQLAWEA